jgi:hypothetical protein
MRKPRFSLAALFVVVTVAAAIFAYLRSRQRDVLESVTGFSIGSGVYSREDVDSLANSLKSLLRREGYKPSPVPSHSMLQAEPERGKWFSRKLRSGTIYVFLFHGPTPTNAHTFSSRAFAIKPEGPFADSGPVETESARLKQLLDKWFAVEIKSQKFRLESQRTRSS